MQKVTHITKIPKFIAIFAAVLFVTFITVLATPQKASACEWYEVMYQPWECFESDDDHRPAQTAGITASCTVSRTQADEGETVYWTVSASGGTGSYAYSWSGSDGLSGNNQTISKSYSNSGTKTASVTVSSGDQSRTVNCSNNVHINDDDDNGNDDDDDDNDNDRDEARDAIEDARDAVRDAREEINDADNDGDDVDDARDLLDDAEDKLEEAEDEYDDNNYDEAIDDAEDAEDLARRAVRAIDEDYDDNDNNYSTGTNVSCAASVTTARVGEPVIWRSYVSGGSSSRYEWSGSEGLRGSSRDITVTYQTPGTKYGAVEVTTSGRRTLRNCANTVYITAAPVVTPTVITRPVYVNNPPTTVVNNNSNSRGFDATCSANTRFANVGDTVTWDVQVSNAPGNVNYIWSGSDGLYSMSNTALVTYRDEGEKIATITLTSNGQSITRSCMFPVTVGDEGDNGQGAAAFFGLGNISWGFISTFLIIILLCVIGYLVFSRKQP